MLLVLRVVVLSFAELFQYIKVSCGDRNMEDRGRNAATLPDLICLHFHFTLTYSHETLCLIFYSTISFFQKLPLYPPAGLFLQAWLFSRILD
jgi:hypothetical protein